MCFSSSLILAMAAVIFPLKDEPAVSIPATIALLTVITTALQHRKPAPVSDSTTNQEEGMRRYEERLRVVEQRLLATQTGGAELDDKERHRLQEGLKAVQEKLADLQQSYEVEVARRRYTEESLEKMEGQLPSSRIAEAKRSLAQKDTQAAEQAFDEVVEKEGEFVALAAYKSGQLAEDRLDYAKAMRQYEKAATLKKDDWDYLFAAGRMANILADYNRAQNWLERLMELIGEAGKDDLDLSFVPFTLANIYVNIEHYEKAKPLYKHLLKIYEDKLGKDHPNVATTINNLATLYEKQCLYMKAESLYKCALKIRKHSLGNDHPDVAQSLNNLALLYEKQRRYKEADPLYKRALSIMKQKFPSGHPHIKTIQGNYDDLKRKMAEQ